MSERIEEGDMSLARSIKRRARAAAAPTVFLALVGYFGWNVMQGDHGLVAFAARKKLLAQANGDLKQAEAQREVWTERVRGLQAGHIEADTVDEQARAMLNLSDPNDIILMYPDKDKLF
jgi:cell division protein FtsB